MTDTVQVPREATEEMIDAGEIVRLDEGWAKTIWRAMLAAAPQATDPRDGEIERLTRERDAALPWQMFYGEGKTLGEIADHFGKSVYAFSPWLTAPLINSAAEAKTKDARAAAQAENEKLRDALTTIANAPVMTIRSSGRMDGYKDDYLQSVARAALSPPPLSPEKP